MLFYRSLLAVTLACSAGPGIAQTIIECTRSAGKAFYFDIDPQTGKPTGWVDDGISNGSVVLVVNDNSVDIIIKDAVGTYSASADGATVTLLEVRDPFVEILVSYPQGSKELYTFDVEKRRLVWSQHKFGVLFDKAATFISECK